MTPWTVAHQAPLSMEFSPGKNTGVGSHSLPNSGIKPGSPALQADSLPSGLLGKPKYLYNKRMNSQINNLERGKEVSSPGSQVQSPFIRARAAQRGGKDTVLLLNPYTFPVPWWVRGSDSHMFPFIRQS